MPRGVKAFNLQVPYRCSPFCFCWLDADGKEALEQWFSDVCMHQNLLDSLLKHSISDPKGPEKGLCRGHF